MKHTDENTNSPTLTFSGAASLLLLVAAFCAYPCGQESVATVLAALAFISLSLGASRPEPTPAPVRVRSRASARRRHPEHGSEHR